MENAPLVRYEQNQDTSFFLCRQCRTHLALKQECLHKYGMNQLVPRRDALFRDLVNVEVGENSQMHIGQNVAPASCINCHSVLGSKFVTMNFETSAIKAGRSMIDLTKLLFWNGTQMLYADTGKPVET